MSLLRNIAVVGQFVIPVSLSAHRSENGNPESGLPRLDSHFRGNDKLKLSHYRNFAVAAGL